jgi:type IV secretory pathway TraG/TraD family ATPase VirD4
MNPYDRGRLGAVLLVVLPLMLWIQAIKRTETYEKLNIVQIIEFAKMTPKRPFLLGALIVGFILAIGVMWLLSKLGKTEYEGARFKTFLRGTSIVSHAKLASRTKERRAEQVKIADVLMPTEIETKHLLITGATGTGKSVGFLEICYSAMRRGDRAIIVDPNGDLYAKLGRPKDILLNPFDRRSPGWDFFNEIRSDYDFERYALSVVGEGTTNDEEQWNGYARLLMAETARKLKLTGNASIHQLAKWTTVAPPNDLKAFLAGTAAESLFVGADKALASARFILSKRFAPHLKMPPGQFSMRDWLAESDGSLFLTWREDMQAIVRPLIGAWIDILSTSVLSLEPDPDSRLWFLLDELASLGKLPSLQDLLTKGRKHGACAVAALQSVAQTEQIYGPKSAQSLLSCFRSTLALGGSRIDAQTCEYASRSLGTHEVERDRYSQSASVRNSGVTTQSEHKEERVVLASQIAGLKDLSGYLSFAGDLPIAKVTLTPMNVSLVNSRFEPREFG